MHTPPRFSNAWYLYWLKNIVKWLMRNKEFSINQSIDYAETKRKELEQTKHFISTFVRLCSIFLTGTNHPTPQWKQTLLMLIGLLEANVWTTVPLLLLVDHWTPTFQIFIITNINEMKLYNVARLDRNVLYNWVVAILMPCEMLCAQSFRITPRTFIKMSWRQAVINWAININGNASHDNVEAILSICISSM